ncbi:exported hypothetical protein [Cupriavidus taiwanensis]|uniref:Uncharacterized protein n=1 Tax=Cupriavidus taiwanensis TaxID=164546 RepID=A0A375E9J1_9BURK|nr:exported hypothetical protein [Cupriavidus taiwanensis]SOZ65653.1 exported hypothetical protein [Cupriavidus taiwanensis]SOZ69330.1 exported hypothetical protein [Cupriavidus taiwanensis]SPA08482.1 exported hypothetical protein [Cupriavidus taiwanensis]
MRRRTMRGGASMPAAPGAPRAWAAGAQSGQAPAIWQHVLHGMASRCGWRSLDCVIGTVGGKSLRTSCVHSMAPPWPDNPYIPIPGTEASDVAVRRPAGTSVLHLAVRAGASEAQAGVSLPDHQDRMRRQRRRVAQPIP